MTTMEEEEDEYISMFEQGHWVWDDLSEGLIFVSDRPVEKPDMITIPLKIKTANIDFKDDIDLLEQVRFRKRYARRIKPGQPEIVTLQDVKDLALYTAPVSLLSPTLINLLHLPTTERLIRALILYCQYYLQISDVMESRIVALESNIRTPESDIVEAEFRDNLFDLRMLVANEYCIFLLGGDDVKKFHHLGPAKKSSSLTDKDAKLMETLFRMFIQIVWIALSRRCFNKIQLEISRIFKSDTFNSAEHLLKTNYLAEMSKKEREVLLGNHGRETLLRTRSPLMLERLSHRPVDYRMKGLGLFQYENLPCRLQYMSVALSAPEEELAKRNVVCGILGLPRHYFDTMLKTLPIAIAATTTNKSASMASRSLFKSFSKSKKSKSSQKVDKPVYGDIILPKMTHCELTPPASVPMKKLPTRPCDGAQRRMWQERLFRLLQQSRCKSQPWSDLSMQ